MEENIEIFICYAREDESLFQGLEKQLRVLQRQGVLTLWHDRNISPGTDWKQEIDTFLNRAHIILLLVSPDFMVSDYCYSIEMKRAMQRHEQGHAKVLPIILRSVHWQEAPFGKLQVLPTDAKPVLSPNWHNQDEAFYNVAEGIRAAIKKLLASSQFASPKKETQTSLKTAAQLLGEGEVLYAQKLYEEALTAFDQAIQINPSDGEAYRLKGDALICLRRYEEASVAYDQALQLNPDFPAYTYCQKATALHHLGRYEEALIAYDQAIQLNPDVAYTYQFKGGTLHSLERYEEALTAYDQAIQLNPDGNQAYEWKGIALCGLERYEEALMAYDRAIQINPSGAYAYYQKGIALHSLKRYKEALTVYDQAIQLNPNDREVYRCKVKAISALERLK